MSAKVRYCPPCNRATFVDIDYGGDPTLEVIKCAVCGYIHYIRDAKQ